MQRPIRRRWKIMFIAFLLGCVLCVMTLAGVIWKIESYFSVKLSDIWGLVLETSQELQQTDGISSIVLLGIAGGTHDGSDLTDSMLLFRMTATGSGIMTHIPRDLWSTTLQDKINSAYHYGEISESGEGLQFTRGTLGSLFGFPIHHAILMDFSQFDDVIDSIGGIDVPIDTTFTDTTYPIAGRENSMCGQDLTYACRYQSVTFTKGIEHMSGARALIYVRSRHSIGDVGTDFSRGMRQKAVVGALIKTVKNWRTWIDPFRTYRFLTTIQTLYRTDMSNEQLIDFGLRMARNISTLRSLSIEGHLKPDTGPQGQYILVPKEDWDALRNTLQQM